MAEFDGRLEDDAANVGDLVPLGELEVLGARFTRRVRVVYANAFAACQSRFGRFHARRLCRESVSVYVDVVVSAQVALEECALAARWWTY